MRARMEVRVTPDDVGQRVSVRYRIEPADRDATDGPGHTDAVGELLSWERGRLRIAKRDGEVVTVPESLLVAGRVVPPPPRRPSRAPR